MSSIATLANHQVRLAKRPVGTPTRDNWTFTTEPVQEPATGGVLIKTLALSLDPAMRGWMNDAKSYIPPVGIGEVMRAGGIGKVMASNNPAFATGDLVSANLGVQEYCAVAPGEIKRSGMFKIDLRLGSIGQWLNVLGFPGMTGNFGCMQGMVVFDYVDRFPIAIAELAGYLKDGRMKSKEDVVQGLDTFPEALTRLFTGQNFGKLVLQIADA